MMERLKPLIQLFLILLCCLGSAKHTWAKESLPQQLAQMRQQEDKAQVLENLSLLLLTQQLNTAEQTEIYLLKGETLFFLHQYNQGINALLKAKKIADKARLFPLIAKANKMLGILYYYQGELHQALEVYQKSLAYYDTNQPIDTNNFAIERANLLNNIALVYTSLGKSSLALINYQLAEPLYANHGSETDQIDIRYNIAALYISLGRFDSAIDILKVVIHKRKGLKNEYGVATARADLGIAYKHSGQFKLAKKNILAALEYFEQRNYKHDIASQLHNMSELYNEMFDVKKAKIYGEKALKISVDIGHQKAYAGSLQSLAQAEFYLGNLVQAKQYIQRSSDVGRRIGFQLLLTENLAISALISAANQQYVKALTDMQQHGKRYQLSANNILNDKLAEFESEQLNQKIVDLEQRRKLQLLELAKNNQQRNIIILILVLALGIVFYIYRRHLESRLTQQLELRVKQRTSELELLSKELAKADQVKNQFLANMSHEIRTPLTAIVGHAEAIIHDSVDKNKIIEDINVIHDNSLHLLELINDILDLSRIEANKFELEIHPLDLGELIQDLIRTFTTLAQQKHLTFTVTHQLPLPFIINVDSLRLKQILLNLCANAVKFTEKGEVTLSINWKNEQLTFTVTDTGIGLSEDHLSQVFNIFTQADNSISRRFGGSGLGLTLSKHLANLMSGNIVVTSKLGKGSTFCLTIPCRHNNSDKLASLIEPHKENNIEKLFKGKVLLAEDHDDNRRLIARLLTSLGLEVTTAKNGKEAVELGIKHQPDLILLDIQMPEMDGVEAFKSLREQGFQQAIYALTANAMSHEVTEYLALGFTGHLKKPIERKKFIAAIANHLSAEIYSDLEIVSLIEESTHQYSQELAKNDVALKAEQSLAQVDLSDLIAEFKVNLSKDKKNIISYSESDDLKSLSSLTHQLAGCAQMFGFSELNQAAKELELLIKKELLTGEPNHEFINELTHCLVDEINLIELQ